MSSINVDSDTKAEFTELQPDDHTQDEFMVELLAAKRRDNGEVVNVDELAESIVTQVHKRTAASVELSAYRGVQEAFTDLEDERIDKYL